MIKANDCSASASLPKKVRRPSGKKEVPVHPARRQRKEEEEGDP